MNAKKGKMKLIFQRYKKRVCFIDTKEFLFFFQVEGLYLREACVNKRNTIDFTVNH